MPGKGGYESGPGGGNGSFWDWVFDREPRMKLVGGCVHIRGPVRDGDIDEICRLVKADYEKRMKAMG